MSIGGHLRPNPDVLVVGAGPAGGMAAYTLATRGLEVLLVDRAVFPRDKVCGCCLNAASVSLLRTTGLNDSFWRSEAVATRRLTIRLRGRRVTLPLEGGYAVPRNRLDSALVAKAVAAGATFLDAARARVQAVDDRSCSVRVTRRGEEKTTRPRVVVCADGLGGDSLAGFAGAPRVRVERRHGRLGAGAVLPPGIDGPPEGEILMAVSRAGYAGMVRLIDGSTNVAAALDRDRLGLTGSPEAAVASVLAEAGVEGGFRLEESDWRGTPLLTRWRVPPASSRVFCLGDAARFVEPFTGEGMAWALAAGRLVSEFVREALEGVRPDLPDRWGRAYRRHLGSRQERCRRISRVLRSPRLCGLALRILIWSPGLAAPLTGRINRPIFGDA
jgi:menaquinone-9 beta-reductase